MKKRILLITIPASLCVALLIFLICFFSIPRLTYTYSTVYEGYLVKKAYGNAKSYTIPKSYKGKKIVGVSTRAFFRHDKLEEIIYEEEENIEFIGRLSFSECKNLKSISLEHVFEIERNAFSYDTSLTSISTWATYIGASTFYGCSNLTTVELKNGVESIGSYAFTECEALKELYLPDSVSTVYEYAFLNSGINKLYASKELEDNTYLQTLNYVEYRG